MANDGPFRSKEAHFQRLTCPFWILIFGQTPESGIPPSFRATMRYSKVCLGLCPQFSTLIGQLGRVPLFGARPWRYIRSWLFSSAFTVLWRALTASWRGNRRGKQLFLRVLRATEPHSDPSTLRNFRMYLGHTDPTLSNLFRHNHGNHHESQQVTTRRRHVAHANARATRIQRGTKGGTKPPPTVPWHTLCAASCER